MCPHPMPWTSWNCHCSIETSFQHTDIFEQNNNPDNLPSCDCTQQKRRRYQLCSDKDQTDGITCKGVGDALEDIFEAWTIRFFSRSIEGVNPNQCLIQDSDQSAYWLRPYLQQGNLKDDFTPLPKFDNDGKVSMTHTV